VIVLRPASLQARLLGTSRAAARGAGCANDRHTNGRWRSPCPLRVERLSGPLGYANTLLYEASHVSSLATCLFRLQLAASTLQRARGDTLQSPIRTLAAISRDHPKSHHTHKTVLTADAQLLRLAKRRARLEIVSLGYPLWHVEQLHHDICHRDTEFTT
jgi:hypothetical protein